MNVSEFRANLKDCFDRAANGEVIEIERGGLVFSLQKKLPVATPQIFDEATDMTQEQLDAITNMKIDIPRAVHIGTDPTTTNEFMKAVEAMPHYKTDPVPDPNSGEMSCCTRSKPCQHWLYNGEVWKNSLSNREREVEQ